MMNSFFGDEFSGYGWLVFWPNLVQFVTALVLWFLAPQLSRFMLEASDSDVAIPKPMAESVVRIVFIVFGVYLIASSIPSLASLVFRVFEVTSSIVVELPLAEMLDATQGANSQLIYEAARISLGIVFIVGNVGFARFVQWARNFALDA